MTADLLARVRELESTSCYHSVRLENIALHLLEVDKGLEGIQEEVDFIDDQVDDIITASVKEDDLDEDLVQQVADEVLDEDPFADVMQPGEAFVDAAGEIYRLGDNGKVYNLGHISTLFQAAKPGARLPDANGRLWVKGVRGDYTSFIKDGGEVLTTEKATYEDLGGYVAGVGIRG